MKNNRKSNELAEGYDEWIRQRIRALKDVATLFGVVWANINQISNRALNDRERNLAIVASRVYIDAIRHLAATYGNAVDSGYPLSKLPRKYGSRYRSIIQDCMTIANTVEGMTIKEAANFYFVDSDEEFKVKMKELYDNLMKGSK